MRKLTRIELAVLLLVTGLAAGFAAGQSIGFSTGSEWAIMQAEIFARESGVFMPVSYEEGAFHVIIKQPRNLYSQARRLAALHHEESQEPMRHELASSEGATGKDRL